MLEEVFIPADPAVPNKDHWYWWLMSGNSWTAPEINNGAPYLPSISNQLLRNVMWWLRNPVGNLFGAVLGVSYKDRWVTGPAPVKLVTWADAPYATNNKWKWAYTRLQKSDRLGLPFISYYGICEFYLGWRPHDGALGFKLVNASRGEN